MDFDPLKVTARNDPPDHAALDDRQVPKAAIIHLPERINSEAIGSDRGWMGRHNKRQYRRRGILAFGKCPHRIATGKSMKASSLRAGNPGSKPPIEWMSALCL